MNELRMLIAHYKLTENDCKREISDTDIVEIASSFDGKWRTMLPPHLEMHSIVVDDIVGDSRLSEEVEKRCAFYKKWKHQKGFKATYETLISALLQLRFKEDACSVCKILKKTVSMPVSQYDSPPVSQKQPSSPTDTMSIPGISHCFNFF